MNAEAMLNAVGGYRFLGAPGTPYSEGVVAETGHSMVRVTFDSPVPLAEGLPRAVAHVADRGRPALALCGLELRIAEPFTRDGFRSFNAGYVDLLRELGLDCDGVIPIARTNVAVNGTPEPGVLAFTYTAVRSDSASDFVLAGRAESHSGSVIERLDSIADGLIERCDLLGVSPDTASAIQAYGPTLASSDLLHVLDRLAPRRSIGVHWFPSRPPIDDITLEVDLRRVSREEVVSVEPLPVANP